MLGQFIRSLVPPLARVPAAPVEFEMVGQVLQLRSDAIDNVAVFLRLVCSDSNIPRVLGVGVKAHRAARTSTVRRVVEPGESHAQGLKLHPVVSRLNVTAALRVDFDAIPVDDVTPSARARIWIAGAIGENNEAII